MNLHRNQIEQPKKQPKYTVAKFVLCPPPPATVFQLLNFINRPRRLLGLFA